MCGIKRSGSTWQWVAWLDGTTECIYSTFCTDKDHAHFRMEVVFNRFKRNNISLRGKYTGGGERANTGVEGYESRVDNLLKKLETSLGVNSTNNPIF